jgi:2-oxoisovalerate dehydrogenase E1 component
VVGAKNWITPPFEFDAFFFPQASWVLDAIHEKIQPLPGYTPENTCDVEETLRRAKQGV